MLSGMSIAQQNSSSPIRNSDLRLLQYAAENRHWHYCPAGRGGYSMVRQGNGGDRILRARRHRRRRAGDTCDDHSGLLLRSRVERHLATRFRLHAAAHAGCSRSGEHRHSRSRQRRLMRAALSHERGSWLRSRPGNRRVGNGSSTRGFSSGTLTIDPQTATVLEHRLYDSPLGAESVETFSDYVAPRVGEGYAARSLRIRTEQHGVPAFIPHPRRPAVAAGSRGQWRSAVLLNRER